MTTEPGTEKPPLTERLSTPVRSQRRPMLLAAAIAFAVVCGVGSYFIGTNLNQNTQVVAIAADIARGDVITESDLGTVEVADADASHFITAEDVAEVVGQTALVDLPAGTVLTPSHLGEPPVVDGTALVGATLLPTQMPATTLHAGDEVIIVATTGPGAAILDGVPTVEATVFAVSQNAEAGTWGVDLSVDEDTAVQIAEIASTGNIALVLASADGGEE